MSVLVDLGALRQLGYQEDRVDPVTNPGAIKKARSLARSRNRSATGGRAADKMAPDKWLWRPFRGMELAAGQ